MADIFISYASADREKARAMADTFAQRGYSVWWDRTIAPGDVFDEVLQRALDEAKCVVVLWSSHAVNSNWVKTEAAEASARHVLVPALIEPARLPIEFKRIQCADLTAWNGDPASPEFENLLASVRRLVAKTASPAAATASAGSAPVRPPPPVASRAKHRALVALALGGVAVAVTAIFFVMRPAHDERPDVKLADAAWRQNPVSPTPTDGPKAQEPLPASSPPPVVADKPAPKPTAAPAVADKLARQPAAAAATSPMPAAPAKSGRINLLASDNGGQLVVAGDPIWKKSITQYEDEQGWAAFGEAVYAFKDQREATFDTFSVLILRTHEANLKDFVLLAGSDSPTGRFEPIGQFSVQNVRLMTSPYQDFGFPPVKARYLKIRLINTHGGRTGGAVLHKFKLMGSFD